MHKLIKLSFGLAIAALVLTGCQTDAKKGDLTLEATVDVENGTKVYVSELGKGNQTVPLDTVEVQNKEFTVNLPKVDFQTLNIMRIDGVNDNLLFINENESITAEIDKENLRASKVEGGQANKIFYEYLELLADNNERFIKMSDNYSEEELQNPAIQQEMMAQIESQNTEFRKKTIKENSDELPSVLMLADIMRTQMVPHDEMQELYDGLSKNAKNSFMGKEIGQELESSKSFSVGSKAPEFSAKTPEGEELALKDALGKYTLVDFWAAWCLPCRQENPNIVDIYDEYHDKGFNVLGVSLDRDRDKWLEAIEKDGLEWNQISNLKFWEDPIAQQYNIKAIPANFLLDEEGKIVATNLRGTVLKRKIEELFAE